MIKVFFVVLISTLILAMTSGMDILRGTKMVDWKKIGMELDLWRHKRALAARNSDNDFPPYVGSQNAVSIPVLLYHGVMTENNWQEDGTNITLEGFKEQMFALKKAGYRTVSLADFFDFVKNGKALPEKAIMITFDDGRKDSYYEGDPVLEAVGYNAVMFLITGRSLGAHQAGDNFYLGKNELQDMIESGRWEIQSHGDFDHNWQLVDPSGKQGHFISNLLWLAPEKRMETPEEAKKRILADLANSKKKISDELGQKVVAFAYPFNDYGQESVNFPESQQFIRDNIGQTYPLTFMQVESDELAGNYPDADALYAKRIDVNSDLSPSALLNILSQNEEKKIPYTDSFWDNRGWKSNWGETRVWGDLTLSETEAGGGSQAALIGTSLWKNYLVKSTVQIASGNSVSQIVRYRNDDNYAECDFSRTGISILQRIGGRDYLLAEKPGDFNPQLGSVMELGAGVAGNGVKCYLNGNLELEAQISPSLSSGGIGFSTWDDWPENASVSVRKVNVSAL